jgi:hypothetical protein
MSLANDIDRWLSMAVKIRAQMARSAAEAA